DTVIKANDHVILFLVDKKFIWDVEKLFQPSALFFG
ncbi:MAG: trk system potassium uptake protein TrkA, partial [Glaciecola sp.]